MIIKKIDLDDFQKNCEKWAQTNPQKAVLLPYVNCADLQFCHTVKDELNLQLVVGGKKYFFHKESGAQKEAEEWFSGLNLNGIPLIYVYGVGLGYYYLAAKNWLHQDPSHRLIFIEDNLSVIHQLFETNLGHDLIHDPQVQLHFFEGMDKGKELFDGLYWNFFLTTLIVTSLQFYCETKQSIFQEIQQKIHYDASLKNSLLIEYLEFGVGFFKNYYPNILSLEGSFLGNDLFGKFQNIPAIICGAGPSLEKNLSLLGNLSNKALIFAGGSAINAINTAHIQPHFGAAIDPNAPQYDRLSTNTAYEVPFFYRNRLLHDAFKTIHGPRLFVTGSGGYDISYLFEEGLDISGIAIEEGHNVVNFCLEIAHALGCNPIIFVGMDLAYTGLKAYAPGVVEDRAVNAEAITHAKRVDDNAILKTDIEGKPIYTLWKWISEAEWIGDFSKAHPDIKVINATEGGIGFPGVPNMTLKEVIDKYLKEDYDLKGMIHSEILNSSIPHVKNKKILQLMQELLESLNRCIEDLEILIEESDVMKERIKKENKVPFPQQTGKASLYENELSEEPGYRYVLHIFNEAYTRVLNRELQGLQTLFKHPSEVKLTLGKIDLLIKRFIFLRDVARVNVELIKMSIRDYKEEKVFSFPRPGKISIEQQKKLGRLEGESIFRSKTQTLAHSFFKEGLQEGSVELFYPSGQLYSRQNFNKGVYEGKQEFYFPDGNLKTILEYQKGNLVRAQLFNPDGTIKKESRKLDES